MFMFPLGIRIEKGAGKLVNNFSRVSDFLEMPIDKPVGKKLCLALGLKFDSCSSENCAQTVELLSI